MDPDDLTDEIMGCGCSKSHNDMANEFLIALVGSLAEIWPDAQGGEFELRVNDSKGRGVVEFGGSVPQLPNDCSHN